jgi:hypothetical protein
MGVLLEKSSSTPTEPLKISTTLSNYRLFWTAVKSTTFLFAVQAHMLSIP